MLKIRIKRVYLYLIALELMLVGEMCFFSSRTIFVYWGLTGFGIICGMFYAFSRFSISKKKSGFLIWYCLVFTLFFLYGTLWLRKGVFNEDTLLYRFVEGIAIYFLLSALIKKDMNLISDAFVVAGIVTVFYLIISEGTSILLGGSRIGDTLSGNVNTVGYNLGLVSFFLMWSFCRDKKKSKIILMLVFLVFMLLTGSKKTMVIIMADMILYFVYEKNKVSRWLKILFLLIVVIFVIFNVPYFYDIIGFRIEAMLVTLFHQNEALLYSYSTDMRTDLILQAFDIFKDYPIFGGGWNYFYSQTSSIYDYSHCNYTELLCSFGIVGTILYYSRHLSHMITAFRYSKKVTEDGADLIRALIVITIMNLTLDLSVVSFSSQIVWYIPLIFSATAINRVKKYDRKYWREEDGQIINTQKNIEER